uniref:Cilia- and flagella-associated protein 43 n=1 Tax=Anabas testudineus TaxID=64144 RepID=A0A7N6ANC1_ANATE
HSSSGCGSNVYCTPSRWIQGVTNKNVAFVDNKTICYTCGTHICFLNLKTKVRNVLQSPGRGIGALTANGNNRIFAFSEQKLFPSIYVYIFPELELKNELKGEAQLDYTSLTLSNSGPYLGCCSSLPDYTITIWNWESAEPVCTQPQAGQNIISLVFNPLNWLQLCALGTSSLTVWNIEKSASYHALKSSVVELPSIDGSFVERLVCPSYTVSDKLPYFGPEMPPSAISGLKGDKAESIVVTSLACCPIAQYAAVGTTSGKVLFIDLNKEQQPRLVHQVHLYHTSVDHLVFDQEGHYLLTGASDSHIFVLDAKPSKRFSVIGYTVVPGSILSLSSQCVRDCGQVKVLALCSRQEGKTCDGCLLTLFTLSTRNLAGTALIDTPSSQQVVQLQPEQEVKGHPLGPASLVLSPHQLWLASVGRDGLLRIRETRYIELQCHSCRLGGVRSVSFSADSQTLLTSGFRDGSLVCTNLRIKPVDADKVNKATWYSQSMAHFLKNVFNKENTALTELPEWSQGSPKKAEDVMSKLGGINIFMKMYLTNSITTTLCFLYCQIQEMMRENENLPEIERLEQHEFNLDVEEQKRLEAMVEKEVTRVRNEMEWEILAKCYLHDVQKRECWDSMKFKGRAIKAFHSDHEVKNYPLKERTEKDMEDLRWVQNIRKIEKTACKVSTNSPQVETVYDDEEKSVALTGSFSAQLGFSNPYIYDQFRLKTTEQRINQIILLQDVIYRIKTAFNTEFEAMHRQKVQELNRVRDRNRHIRDIMQELDMNEKLWEPSLSNSEWPERMLTVDDSEIKAEKYLTPEQKKKEEERKKLEEHRHLAAKEDNSRERALDDMMDGVLEVKKDDILKMEIPPPEFVLTKLDIHWSEEEKKAYKEFEKKTKDLNEEKEKYKKVLQHEEELELFHETYESLVAEDKVLDKEFRKEFFDVPAHVVDHLYKLFKRRPRVQKMRTQTENNSSPFKEQRLCGSLAPDALGKMLKTMEELDAPENIPEGLNPSIWERFCLVRRTKVESEQKVKIKALTLAEMQAFLQKRRDEEKAAQQEIKNLSDELESLHKEKKRFLTDTMVQFVLKQGQVEVSTTDLTADYTDSVLQHRSVVEDLNRTIRMLAEQKIASMVECKDFRKGIIRLEWEHKMRRMQIEDLNNKTRDIQMLRLTEEQQDVNRDRRVSKQVSILEKTIAFQEKVKEKSGIEQLNRQAAMKAVKNTILEQQLPDMQVTVAERKHIYEAIGNTTITSAAKTEERYQEIVQKKNLEDFARAQAEELAFLWAELERLRMKNFPSLDKLKHN